MPPERAIYEARATGVKLFALNWPSETDLIADILAHPGFGLPIGVYANAVLLRRINVIWVVQSSIKKYCRSHPTQITCISLAVSSLWRSGSRSSRTRDGMRWTRAMSKDE